MLWADLEVSCGSDSLLQLAVLLWEEVLGAREKWADRVMVPNPWHAFCKVLCARYIPLWYLAIAGHIDVAHDGNQAALLTFS